ncbi:N-acetylmuramoyl-L-alanine amidase [Spongiactinospora sp. TRM90649]|uniref:N-acetylmuramoyl-L-alanine amidase n=1 Tax=Spongiactinospora sp. TRM90649 TaxID=3031114 RepID=UPI0023F901DC|nr:N-acetylmuramoyl-L-alanine amidase [Spongiactinospora sp. TRM90649]MDF5754474.1 N-acetylmuramoyl-L-alanine amidase [Spongiactinospora sp. TRM90649]
MTSRAVAGVAMALCGLTAAACGTAGAGATPAFNPPPATPQQQAAPSEASRSNGSKGEPSSDPAPGSTASDPLHGKVVVIDPGHNGGNAAHPEIINREVDVLTKRKPCDTTGTSTNNGYSEAAFTWDVSKRMAAILRAKGATVKLTRKNNTSVGPCITERAAIGNKAKADAAISVHADGAAPANHGFHVIMPKKINGPVDPVVADSRKLGIAVRDAFRAGTGLPYSNYIGDKALDFRDDLGGLNLSTVPKVFVESGNMRNPTEAAKFHSPAFRQKIAQALADGVQNYLN